MALVILFDMYRRKGESTTMKNTKEIMSNDVHFVTHVQVTNVPCHAYGIIIKELQDHPAHDYSVAQAEALAQRVLADGDYAMVRGVMPVVRIAEKFGFRCFLKDNLDENISGNIYVGGTTRKVYDTDKVIFVSSKERVEQQRFVIAHELGHYLMDYLGSEKSLNSKLLFSKTYPKQDHDSQEEVRADRFAAELLMPAREFLRRYIQAMTASNNDSVYTISYLTDFFGVKQTSVRKRISEVFW